MFERSRSLQIYVKPGIKEDDILIGVWEAAKKLDRPQDVFRSMLRAGLMAMLESGELPESIIDECDLDIILEKRMRRKNRKNGQGLPPHNSPSGYQVPIHAPVPWPQTGHPVHPTPVYAPLQDSSHHIPETTVYAPSAQHRPVATSPASNSTGPKTVAVEKKADQPINQSADENKANASPSGNSKVNRLKNLM